MLIDLFSVAAATLCLSTGPQEPVAPPFTVRPTLDVMTWNIWHGGREDGAEEGPTRVIDVIRTSGCDLLAMQETYGSGPKVSKALGFHFHERGTNVSIMSRFPVVEDLSVHEEFQNVGALIQLPDQSLVAFYSIWLPYSAEIWEEGTRDVSNPGSMIAACAASEKSLLAMRAAIEARLAAPKYASVPVIIAGDFNSMSHLDYGEVGLDQYEVSVDWPTGHLLWDAGFTDAYRETHPVIDRAADSTWTPRFPAQEQDRIDFVFYRADRWQAASASVVREHPDKFPSDHAAVVARFERCEPRGAAGEVPVVAASYNIKHGVGMDEKLDFERTTKALRALDADVIGLQEVDLGTRRSQGRNEVNKLAAALDMHPVFGAFMGYDGGHYGMALLSKFPVVAAKSVRLAEGNEPRIALAARLRLPTGDDVYAVNVHFDWVKDDGFRFAQAQEVARFLEGLDLPYILLGDFNDQPGSRTLELFGKTSIPIPKPASARFTFPADKPTKEIDFLFHSKAVPGKGAWRAAGSQVAPEELASDHRPVKAMLRFVRQAQDENRPR